MYDGEIMIPPKLMLALVFWAIVVGPSLGHAIGGSAAGAVIFIISIAAVIHSLHKTWVLLNSP